MTPHPSLIAVHPLPRERARGTCVERTADLCKSRMALPNSTDSCIDRRKVDNGNSSLDVFERELAPAPLRGEAAAGS